MGWLLTQGAEGLQEEFSEGGGHRQLYRTGATVDIEERVGHHVEVVIEIVELAGRETRKAG